MNRINSINVNINIHLLHISTRSAPKALAAFRSHTSYPCSLLVHTLHQQLSPAQLKTTLPRARGTPASGCALVPLSGGRHLCPEAQPPGAAPQIRGASTFQPCFCCKHTSCTCRHMSPWSLFLQCVCLQGLSSHVQLPTAQTSPTTARTDVHQFLHVTEVLVA